MAGTRIGVIGCAGRMGRMLIADIVASEGCELAGGAAKPGSAAVGRDLGELTGVGRVGIAATADARQVLRDSDVAIDFTTPDATASHAALAAELGRPVVIGTTGLSGEQEAAIRRAAERAPVVWAANTSLGINLLLGLVEQVAARLGPEWDIEIVEMHHRGKVDAPSGTALALGRNSDVFAAGVDIHGVHNWNRQGRTAPDVASALAGDGITEADLREAARVTYESSPISAVATWKSPVLLIHGDDDRTVNFHQTVDLRRRLFDKGVRVEELVLPDDVHDALLWRNWKTSITAMAQFFEQTLQARPVAASPRQ